MRTWRFGTAEREDVVSVADDRGLVEGVEVVSTGLAKSAASRDVVRSGAEGLVARVGGRGIESSLGAVTIAEEGKWVE